MLHLATNYTYCSTRKYRHCPQPGKACFPPLFHSLAAVPVLPCLVSCALCLVWLRVSPHFIWPGLVWAYSVAWHLQRASRHSQLPPPLPPASVDFLLTSPDFPIIHFLQPLATDVCFFGHWQPVYALVFPFYIILLLFNFSSFLFFFFPVASLLDSPKV